MKSWGWSSDGTSRQSHCEAGKKKPFAHLTWRDVLSYVEETQEVDGQSDSFRSLIVDLLPRAADFLTLGTAAFLQVPSTGDRLDLVAWTRPDEPLEWSMLLDPPLKLRLIAGIPQVLTGPEKSELGILAQKSATRPTVPIALPLVAEPRTLVGVVVLLDTAPFDLEEEDFALAWTQYKYTLLNSLAPRQNPLREYRESALMRSFETGHGFLCAELDTRLLDQHCDRVGLPFRRVERKIEQTLQTLVGAHGAVLRRGEAQELLTALFILPVAMDRDLLWHQIQSSLVWPPGFTPAWDNRVVDSPGALQAILGR